MTTDLLPPNATKLERALDAATARIGDVDLSLSTLLDPQACPMRFLPFLAWGLSVDSWDPAWPDATKRQAVAESIAIHRRKGTRLALEMVLARHDRLLSIVEWFEAAPRARPHTFEVLLPLVTVEGAPPDPTRSSVAFADAIIADIVRTKPLREHFQLVQALLNRAPIALVAAGRAASFTRADVALTIDTDSIWSRLLQTEDGEPLEDDTGAFLEDA